MATLSLAELDRQTNIAINYLKLHNKRLKYGATALETLDVFLVKWNDIYPKSQDDATRTPLIIDELHEVKTELEKAYRMMQQSLKHSSEVVLTEEDRNQLFIPHDKSRSPIPRPTILPKIDVIGRSVRKITVQISDPSTPDLNHTRLPDGVSLVNIFIAIVDADTTTAPSEDAYHLFASEGRTNIELSFEAKEEKKLAYIKAAFVNSKGQSGDVSNAINTIIPN